MFRYVQKTAVVHRCDSAFPCVRSLARSLVRVPLVLGTLVGARGGSRRTANPRAIAAIRNEDSSQPRASFLGDDSNDEGQKTLYHTCTNQILPQRTNTKLRGQTRKGHGNIRGGRKFSSFVTFSCWQVLVFFLDTYLRSSYISVSKGVKVVECVSVELVVPLQTPIPNLEHDNNYTRAQLGAFDCYFILNNMLCSGFRYETICSVFSKTPYLNFFHKKQIIYFFKTSPSSFKFLSPIQEVQPKKKWTIWCRFCSFKQSVWHLNIQWVCATFNFLCSKH